MQFRASRIARQHVPKHPNRTLSSWKALFLLVILAQGPLTCAQESSPQPGKEKTSQSSQNTRGKEIEAAPVALFVMLNRKSIVFPDIAADSARLSTGKKFELFVDNSISLNAVTGAAFGAGLAQAADTPRGFRQGGDGYAKRFGSSMARQASSNFFGTFLLASALHQDPRFFPKRETTVGRSVRYSLERVVVIRNDDGRDVKNWSGLLGPLLSEGLANAYWPEQDRTAGQTFRRYGIDLAVRAGTNMLREYWPSIVRKMGGVRPAPAGRP